MITYADTTVYPGEAREIQIKPWQGFADPGVCRFFEPDDEVTYHGHHSPVNNGSVRPMPGIVFGGALQTQNVTMINQSNQTIQIPGGTVIGTATSMDHLEAPQLICDWGHLSQGEELLEEEQHLQHVYKLAEEPVVRERMKELWAEMGMENPDKHISKNGRRALYKIVERHMEVFKDEEVKVGCTNWVEMEIRIKEDARPVCAKVRPLSNSQRDNLRAQLDT